MNNNASQNLFFGNRPLILLLVGVIFLILISLVLLLANPSEKTPSSTTNPTITPINIPTLVPVSDSKSQEVEVLKKQAAPQIDKLVGVPYTISKSKIYKSDWAVLKITSTTTDPANVVLKKEGGSWKVVLGPGTYFDDQDLQSVGAPEEISNVINGRF